MWSIGRGYIKLENEIWSRETSEKVVTQLKNYMILNKAEVEVKTMKHPLVMAARPARPSIFHLYAPGTKQHAWPILQLGLRKYFTWLYNWTQFILYVPTLLDGKDIWVNSDSDSLAPGLHLNSRGYKVHRTHRAKVSGWSGREHLIISKYLDNNPLRGPGSLLDLSHWSLAGQYGTLLCFPAIPIIKTSLRTWFSSDSYLFVGEFHCRAQL